MDGESCLKTIHLSVVKNTTIKYEISYNIQKSSILGLVYIGQKRETSNWLNEVWSVQTLLEKKWSRKYHFVINIDMIA